MHARRSHRSVSEHDRRDHSQASSRKCKSAFSDFLFEHVRLIASVVTVVFVLSLVLITDVVDWTEAMMSSGGQAEKKEITLTYVQGLSEKGAPIMWSDLSKFRRLTTDSDDSLTWMLPVKGTDYEVWISGVSADKAPTYVYLFDMKTGERVDLNREDLDSFLDSHP